MKRAEDLRRILEAIDRKSYPAYKDTRGGYRFGSYSLFIEHVQGDPFATPSRVSVLVDGGQAGFPEELYRERHRRIALEDHLLRLYGRSIRKTAAFAFGWKSVFPQEEERSVRGN